MPPCPRCPTDVGMPNDSSLMCPVDSTESLGPPDFLSDATGRAYDAVLCASVNNNY